MRRWIARPEAAIGALVLLTALRLLVAARTNLAPDEAYYWVWSRALQPGYLDDAPMVALWIRLGTLLAGASAIGVRLLGPLAAAAGSVLLWRAAADLFPVRTGADARGADARGGGSWGVGLWAAALLNATLMLGAGSVIITPDTPLLLFWGLGLFAMARLIATGQGRWWLAAGLAGGLALDSKYTGLLFLAAVGVWLLVSPEGRRWLGRPEPWLGLALAALVFAPVVAWNAAHGFASFLKQGGRVGAWRPADALRFQAELWAGQAGLFTPLVFVLALAGTGAIAARAWRRRTPEAVLLSLLSLLPAAVFIEHALGGRVQGNWPAVLYPSAVLAGATLGGRWQRLRAPAVALGLAITGVVYLQALAAPLPLPVRLDPSLRELGGWTALAADVAAIAREDGARFVAARNYGLAAELAFHAPAEGSAPVIGVAPRWRYFRLPPAEPALAGKTGLMLTRQGRARPDPRVWAVLAAPRSLVRTRRGEIAERYRLWRVRLRGKVVGAVLPARAEGASVRGR